ncbi:Pkinase-domain-containing protein [Coniochaeta sp. PMI_546]|nr:Pkinase-domain-containing protein [Coniochaeta sp. PMI_546]
MVAKGIDMEALSPRDANARRPPASEFKTAVTNKATAALKPNKEKDQHPLPPPPNVTEPPSTDRREGAVYQVGKLLGKGGFAICYEGKLAGTSKRYALKIVKSKMPLKMEQKFQTELQIHSKMRQQNIVQFHRAFTFEESTYLVLELCPNGSLMDMVKARKGLTEPEVRFYTVQIAGAIKYMHSKGIIHRDLKMGNIFLDKHMNAKIGDFGLAALLVTGRDWQTIRRTTLCGTPNYIAPEILEKGKRGHDHMVDIWSLGIIMFAMLTTKPPFQSKTTDEIYRRAKERDYEWPSPETSKKYISREAKDLVASMLTDAELRPDPDQIVQDNFFVCGYMPVPSDINSKLRDCAPQNPAFYDPITSAQMESQNRHNLRAMCRECGVGPWNQEKLVTKQIWRECAEEEQYNLTPVIPLAKGIVYRPFDEVKTEQKLQSRIANYPPPSSQQPDRTEELSALSQSAFPPKAPSGLLRAPPQSFAAQQRAQSKPPATTTTFRSQTVTETSSKTAAGTVRTRTRRELPSSSVQKAEEAATPTMTGHRLVRANAATSSVEQEVVPRRAQPTASRPRMKDEQTQEDRISLFNPSEYQEEVPDTQPDLVLDRLRKLQAELERALNSRSMAILKSTDKTPSPPQIVVKWVDYTNKFGLGYILNDGSVGCILRSIPTQDGNKTAMLPPACMLVHGAERHCLRRDDINYADRHQIVPMNEGIYFYENNGEQGITRVRVSPETFRIPMNSDGTVGKLSAGRDVYDHRKRERIVLWKKFANYMIAYGREIESSNQADDRAMQVPTITDPTAAPTDIVTFYQRFGDVGCWMFCDGHMQFNFPDHTKIVLDSTGTWCHFWHLPAEAAKKLEETGSLDEAALDDRTVLSYPLQTLLNFSVPPKQPATRSAGTRAASSSSSARRLRPEISPELQGIPAANQFRRKIEFIRDMVREWNANGGIGNSDMSRERRLRWTGVRETKNVQIPAKHVWVSIGARWGDERYSCFVDPRRPAVLGEDVDEARKERRA